MANDFGVKLRQARLAKDMSQAALAEAIGLSTPYVLDVEHGRRAPFPTDDGRIVYERLAHVLGGSEWEWRAVADADRLLRGTQLPDHVRELVHLIIVRARDVTPAQAHELRTAITGRG